MYPRLGACLLALALASCGKSRGVDVTDNLEVQCGPVDASTTCPTDASTFETVHRIVLRSCVPCHHGNDPDGPWPLIDYNDIASWAGEIKDHILTCEMPPADGGVPITDEQRSAIVQWVLCHAPP